jgi:signal recognition particle subunit SRP68
MIRCYHLARLHCIHPTPSFASAVQLLTRASLLSRQATTSLFESDTPLQEEIISLPVDKVNDLSTCIEALDLAAKRSLFAERVPKPVFFDTAFNYIDMPLDELLVLAGKKVAGAAPKVAEEMVGLVVPAVRSVVGKERTREARPALDDGGRAGGKGWLGGWFGRT